MLDATKQGGKRRYPESYIREELARHGFELIGEYRNTYTNTTVRCSFGHVWKTTVNFILTREHGCRYCKERKTNSFGNANIQGRKTNLLSDAEVQRRLDKYGLKLVEKYKGLHLPHMVVGRCGHRRWETYLTNVFSKGSGCQKCATAENGRRKRLDFETIRNALKNRPILLLSNSDEYESNKTRLRFKCLVCEHQWKSSWISVYHQNSGCPRCEDARRSGENHHFWRGGTNIYPQRWTKNLRKVIRGRDAHTCQYADSEGMCDYQDNIRGNRALHVHHIDGNKNNCNEWNLISLCPNHHQTVEKNNPERWKAFFYAITAIYKKEPKYNNGVSQIRFPFSPYEVADIRLDTLRRAIGIGSLRAIATQQKQMRKQVE